MTPGERAACALRKLDLPDGTLVRGVDPQSARRWHAHMRDGVPVPDAGGSGRFAAHEVWNAESRTFTLLRLD